MKISECYVGQRVYHESANNAKFLRGVITDVQFNGTVFVQWDDLPYQIRHDPAILEAEDGAPVVRSPDDELRNQLQNILAVAGCLADLITESERLSAQADIETAVSTIMEKVAPVLEEKE